MERGARGGGAAIEGRLEGGGWNVGGESVRDRDRLRVERKGCRRKAGRAGFESNCAGGHSGERFAANNDAVDAVLDGQRGGENVVAEGCGADSGWRLGDTAAPLCRALEIERDHGIGGWTALTFGVDDLDIDEREVGAVGMQTAGTGVRREADGGWGASGVELCGGDGLARGVEGDGFKSSGSECHAGESEEEVVGLAGGNIGLGAKEVDGLCASGLGE